MLHSQTRRDFTDIRVSEGKQAREGADFDPFTGSSRRGAGSQNRAELTVGGELLMAGGTGEPPCGVEMF